jgi:hypothetical protein
MGRDADREQRLAEALRANLHRRKAQQRAGDRAPPKPKDECDPEPPSQR